MWWQLLASGGRLLSDLIGFDGESFGVLERWTTGVIFESVMSTKPV